MMSNEKTDLVRREFEETVGCNDPKDGVFVYHPVNNITVGAPSVNVEVNVSDQKTSTRTEENSSTTNPSLGDVGGFISTLLNLIDK